MSNIADPQTCTAKLLNISSRRSWKNSRAKSSSTKSIFVQTGALEKNLQNNSPGTNYTTTGKASVSDRVLLETRLALQSSVPASRVCVLPCFSKTAAFPTRFSRRMTDPAAGSSRTTFLRFLSKVRAGSTTTTTLAPCAFPEMLPTNQRSTCLVNSNPGANEENPDGELIPFVYGKDGNIRHFNDVTTTAAEVQNGFNLFNEGFPAGNVPTGFTDMQDTDEDGNVYRGVDACYRKAFNGLRQKLVDNFDEEWPKLPEERDWATVRSYLARADGLKFPQSVIDWIEKHKSGTGRYARNALEEVLEAITFGQPRNEKPFKWFCLEGGSEVLIDNMLSKLSVPPFCKHHVTAVTEEDSEHPLKRMKVSILDLPDEYFSHVVSTVALGALRTINTDGVCMNFNQREAMRAITYGQSVKAGIKFKTRWWEQNAVKHPQLGGASRTDRQSRVVVYPSYGLNETGPGVLMVSYNWDQDASRFGALIRNHDSRSVPPIPGRIPPASEKVFLEQIYRDLAIVHTDNSKPEEVEKFKEMLKKDTLDYHAFNWFHNPFTMGAFAQFTPGQFSTLYADILKPAGRHGNFYFAGELTSHRHAWVAGALDSANRVVRHIVDELPHEERGDSDPEIIFLPMSLVFDSQDSVDEWHLWGLVEEVEAKPDL